MRQRRWLSPWLIRSVAVPAALLLSKWQRSCRRSSLVVVLCLVCLYCGSRSALEQTQTCPQVSDLLAPAGRSLRHTLRSGGRSPARAPLPSCCAAARRRRGPSSQGGSGTACSSRPPTFRRCLAARCTKQCGGEPASLRSGRCAAALPLFCCCSRGHRQLCSGPHPPACLRLQLKVTYSGGVVKAAAAYGICR